MGAGLVCRFHENTGRVVIDPITAVEIYERYASRATRRLRRGRRPIVVAPSTFERLAAFYADNHYWQPRLTRSERDRVWREQPVVLGCPVEVRS